MKCSVRRFSNLPSKFLASLLKPVVGLSMTMWELLAQVLCPVHHITVAGGHRDSSVIWCGVTVHVGPNCPCSPGVTRKAAEGSLLSQRTNLNVDYICSAPSSVFVLKPHTWCSKGKCTSRFIIKSSSKSAYTENIWWGPPLYYSYAWTALPP